ncbi:MAG: hypothetical protein H6581_14820 [Bacteroidia bacterium]|nr:hypothetical protein [Bacteroidia bacterium]
MKNYLLVPVTLDALHLSGDQLVNGAAADFSRLPFVNGKRDVNSNYANISEELVDKPFQSQRLYLKAGVHLHWALPQALTRGIHKNGELYFPAAPNRWLITRSFKGKVEQQWVVESDYLFPEGDDQSFNAVTIPWPFDQNQRQPFQQPYRYLGRKMFLSVWLDKERAGEEVPPEYLPRLNAMGYGEPAFAAYYPNCHSVFGLFDPGPAESVPVGTEYDLVGWYSDPAQDYIREYLLGQHKPEELSKVLAEDIQWHAGSEGALPAGMLCVGKLSFTAPAQAESAAPDRITLANTATEALSAHLAATCSLSTRAETEDRLEALQLSGLIRNKQLDLGPAFREARHRHSFNSRDAEDRWVVRKAGEKQPQEDAPLPAPVADLLNTLNTVQQYYDLAGFKIDSLRRQLFNDWYKYMVCSYPPKGDREGDFPDIDAVKYFIEKKGIPGITHEEELRGSLHLEYNPQGKLTGARSTGSDFCIARQVERLILSVLEVIDTLNQEDTNQTYVLQKGAHSRFYQPTEPAVLIAGGNVKSTGSRLGSDHSWRPDGLLPCRLLQATDLAELVDNQFARVRQEIHLLPAGTAGHSQSTGRPWNPFRMDWRVELYPLEDKANLQSADRNYDPQFLNANFELSHHDSELRLKTGKGRVSRSNVNIYQGSTLLSFDAHGALLEKLSEFILRSLKSETEFSYLTATNLAEKIGEISAAYGQRSERSVAVEEALKAYAELLHFGGLSQSLGGFNEALIMQKQTMLLPIHDPLAFPDYQAFTDEKVRQTVRDQATSAPEPFSDFNPIRAGVLKLTALRLVDTFGLHRDLDCSAVQTPETMKVPDAPRLALLPPRLAQPARLNFNWLSAQHGLPLLDEHPAGSPVSGWFLHNHFDESLFVYDQEGKYLGSIDRDCQWNSPPGALALEPADAIGDACLLRTVQYLLGHGSTFLGTFIKAIDKAASTIYPDSFEQHLDLALLIGRPVALVKANLSLELKGNPAVRNDWQAFRQDMKRNSRRHDHFTQVRVPVQLGRRRQFSDGLIAWWNEDAGEDLQMNFRGSGMICARKTESPAPDQPALDLSLADPGLTLTLLVDPRAPVHATCGVLPAKSIGLPKHHISRVLKSMEMTFLTHPVMSLGDKLPLPLPDLNGYAWNWEEKRGAGWSAEMQLALPAQQEIFSGKSAIREGWLRLSQAKIETPIK